MSGRSSEPGWLGTAGGALLLVVVGFAVGLLAGTAFEAPDLVIDQLAGRGERVPMEEVELSPGSRIPSVSAARHEEAPGDPEFDSGSESEGRPAVRSGPPAVASPAPARMGGGPGYSIQVGAFADVDTARDLATRLRGHELPGHVVEGEGSPWRVRVGPYASEAEARDAADRLRAEHELPTWLVRVEGS